MVRRETKTSDVKPGSHQKIRYKLVNPNHSMKQCHPHSHRASLELWNVCLEKVGQKELDDGSTHMGKGGA